MTKATTIDDPFFKSKPSTWSPDPNSQSVSGSGSESESDGIQVMSVDILPTQLPLDASRHFSQALMPYLRALVREYQGAGAGAGAGQSAGAGVSAGASASVGVGGDAPLVDALNRATIARGGKLMPNHEWLYASLDKLDKVGKVGKASKALGGLSSAAGGAEKDAKMETKVENKEKVIMRKEKKTVLLFGSGMVARPAVEEFLKRPDINLVVGQ